MGSRLYRCVQVSFAVGGALCAVFGAPPSYAAEPVFHSIDSTMVAAAPAAGTVYYSYDAAGNVTRIQSQPRISSFSPTQGNVGTQVTISGSGFSAAVSGDTVKFDGTPASIVSASTTQLVATVPNGAITGPISVTVAAKTVTSSGDFTVTQPPSISSFSPVYGPSGATVTVSGSYLDPVTGQTTVTLNGNGVPIDSINNTQLVFSVPSTGTSGLIQVTTPYGQATSSSNYLVLPSAIATSAVAATAEVTVGGPAQSLSTTSQNQYVLVYFYANKDDWLSLQLTFLLTNPAAGAINYSVYSPTNAQIASGTVSESNMSIHLPQAPATGLYLVAFNSGSYTVQLSAELLNDAKETIDGASVSVSTSMAGQSERLLFDATAGQNLGLGLTGLWFTPSTPDPANVMIYTPSGGTYDQFNYDPSNVPGYSEPLNDLPETGTYSVVVTPPRYPTSSSPGSVQMGVTGTLTSDVTASLKANTYYTLNLPNYGQQGLLTFTVTANELVDLEFSHIICTPKGVWVTIFPPGQYPASPMKPTLVTTSTVQTFSLKSPTAGTYTVIVSAEYAAAPCSVAVDLVPQAVK